MSETVNNFSLPSGFTAVEYADGDYARKLLDDLRKDDAEVWLIKAPLGADIKALNGQKLKLDRKSLCKCENGKSRQYEIAHHSSVPNELESSVLMVPDFDHGDLKPCTAKISGYLSISETVTLPETQYPAVVDSKVPFPQNLRLRHVPFGADYPVEPSSPKLKKRKHIETSDDENPRKKKSKKTKLKESSSEKPARSLGEDSDTELQVEKEVVLSPIKKQKKRKGSSEDECENVVKTVKRADMDKNCDHSSAENVKAVVNVKEEILTPVKTHKTKKTKRQEESLKEDSPRVKDESHSHKKKPKRAHLDEDFSANPVTEDCRNGGMHVDSDIEETEKLNKKHKKHKKEK